MICCFSLKNAFSLYKKAKTRNFDTAQTSMFFSASMEKKELNEAFLEASQFQVSIEEKRDDIKNQVDTMCATHPADKVYLCSLLELSDMKSVETFVDVLTFSLRIAEQIKKLVTSNVKENINFLDILIEARASRK